jgi:hypothetical protein
MSLYNQLFKTNDLCPIFLQVIGLEFDKIPRFRDIRLVKNKDELVMEVFTRTGGGNREHYLEGNKYLQDKSNYLYDLDDDYDSTYAYFYFSILKEFKESIEKLYESSPEDPNVHSESPMNKFNNLLKDLEANKETEGTKRALDLGKKLFSEIEKGENKIIEV